MIDALTLNTDRAHVSLELELEGRRCPGRLRVDSTQDSVPAHRIPLRDEDRAIAGLLSRAVADSLAWSSLPAGECDRQTLVTTYIRSLERLLEFRREAETFVRLACEVNLEFRQASAQLVSQARDDVLRERLDELRQKAVADWPTVGNILDAKRVSQDIAQLRAQLQANVQAAVDGFGEQFLRLLGRLVDANVFGLVEWLPNQCCAYHFFKQVVIQTETTQTTTVDRKWMADEVVTKDSADAADDEDDDVDPEDDDDWFDEGVMRTTTTETTSATHVHRLARHEHAVMNAIRTTIGNSKVVMPPSVERLIHGVPKWLYPFVRVIDGDLFRERIVEQDLREQTWSETRVTVQDLPVFGPEPAVIVGPYVLTGWGPREVAVEQDRLATVRKDEPQQQHAENVAGHVPIQCAVAALLSLLSVAVAAIVAATEQGMLIWLATSIVAGVAVWHAYRGLALTHQSVFPQLQVALQTTTVMSGVLLVQWLAARFFISLHWITPVILAAVMWVAESLGSERRTTEGSSWDE
jgi:hypothetical protein